MMGRSFVSVVLAFVITACGHPEKNEWEGMNYDKIVRDNYRRENDSSYVPPPSVVGCVDDDLYNCKVKRY